MRSDIAAILTSCGIKVDGEAGDGLEALRKARHLKPNIILMDIGMPVCNGLEATRLIKTEMPQIKIIIVTAYGGNEYFTEAINCGADGFMRKPFREKNFLSILQGVISNDDDSPSGTLSQA